MTKKELVDKIASKSEKVSKNQVEEFLNNFTDSILDSLKEDDSITLQGFGTFSSRIKEATTARNPQTGEPIQVPRKKMCHFKWSPKAHESIR